MSYTVFSDSVFWGGTPHLKFHQLSKSSFPTPIPKCLHSSWSACATLSALWCWWDASTDQDCKSSLTLHTVEMASRPLVAGQGNDQGCCYASACPLEPWRKAPSSWLSKLWSTQSGSSFAIWQIIKTQSRVLCWGLPALGSPCWWGKADTVCFASLALWRPSAGWRASRSGGLCLR